MNEDSSLIEQYLSGDVEALGKLVAKHQKKIYTTMYMMTGDMETAKDLTQETFVRAMRGLKGFRGRSSFMTWLYRIAVNTCRTKARKQRFKEVELDESMPLGQPDPLAAFIESEKKSLVRSALDRLPHRQKEALVLRVYEGLSCQETAHAMGCSTGAAKAHYHHAIKKLKKMARANSHAKRP